MGVCLNKSELLEKIQLKIGKYYHDYYWRELGHKNWEIMVEARKKEDETLGQRSVDWVRDWIPGDISNGKVLIVGAGTGAETVSFSKGASHVTALEPSTDACSIIEDKV